MDKKQTIIVSIISAIVLIMIIAVVIVSEKTPRLKNDEVLKVGEKVYTTQDLRKFSYIKNEIAGDINKVLSDEEKQSICDQFVQQKIYAAAASTKKIIFPSGDETGALNTYESKKEQFEAKGITSGDYLAYAEDEYLYNTLSRDFGAYYTLPEEIYTKFTSQYSGDDLKTYSFRKMMFRYEEPESGDTLESGDSTEEPKEDRSIETMRAKAEKALEDVKNGVDFEEVAKENADMDLVFTSSGISRVNGELQHSISPSLNYKINATAEVVEKIKTMKSGEITDVMIDEEGKRLFIVKVESIEDGFVGEADNEVRAELLNENVLDIIIKSVNYQDNVSGMLKYMY